MKNPSPAGDMSTKLTIIKTIPRGMQSTTITKATIDLCPSLLEGSFKASTLALKIPRPSSTLLDRFQAALQPPSLLLRGCLSRKGVVVLICRILLGRQTMPQFLKTLWAIPSSRTASTS